jgi:inorganic pyrophosphatase
MALASHREAHLARESISSRCPFAQPAATRGTPESETMSHPWHDVHIGPQAPEEFQAVIEIPKGSKVKYELDKETGLLRVDRILSSSVIYPASYGFIPQTLGDDHDPLDVLVLMQEPVVPLSILRVRPIGMMTMLDQGENDEKIICIHLDDPEYREYTDIAQLPTHRMNEVRRFFEDYKALENKEVLVQDFLGPEEARKAVKHAMALYETLSSHMHRQKPRG